MSATSGDGSTPDHPLAAAVRAVASLSEQRDLLAYLLHVAVYKMHPTAQARIQNPEWVQPVDLPFPCGFNFRVASDDDALAAMDAILAEQWRKADEAQRDFLEHGAELLARWHKAHEQ
jgi:hypothetical protein